jgi:hypothetical protein
MRIFLLGLLTGAGLVAAAGAGYSAGSTRAPVVPDSAFAVSKGGASLFRVNANGLVGINTSDPQARLDVNGNLRVGVIELRGGTFLKFDDGTTLSTVPPTVSFYVRSAHTTFSGNVTALCDDGDHIVGGGFESPSSTGGLIWESRPVLVPHEGWYVANGGQDQLTAWAICQTLS